MAITIHIPNTMTVDQLQAELNRHMEPSDYMIYSQHSSAIERDHQLIKHGIVRATWKSRLVNIPPLDGVTPRGPSEYYDLRFFPLPNQ